MWVADMDFAAAPEILAAMQQRLDHGVFGYSVIPDTWRQAHVDWWRRRHQVSIDPRSLLFVSGVIPGIASILRKMTAPGDRVLMLTPIYNSFYGVIRDNDRVIEDCPLDYVNGVYSINFERLETQLAKPEVKVMIVCNPHNPTGTIWDKDTLERIATICKAQDVLVIADEIHCDLTDPGKEYVPYLTLTQTLCERVIVTVSATKAFNLAGVQGAALIVPDAGLRKEVQKGLDRDHITEANAFSLAATVAAFEEGEAWLDALREYIYDNKQLVKNYMQEHMPELFLVESEATYLLWVDCSRVTDDVRRLTDYLRKETGLFVTDGHLYGEETGRKHFRWNIACPRAVLEDGLARLELGLKGFLQLEEQ